MQIFLAGTSVSNPETEVTLPKLFKKGHKLHSYYHLTHGLETKWGKENMKNKVDLFIDSGAYSAFTQKVEINIQDYIQFIKDNLDVISVYANLDVIGDPKGTFKNQQIMEAAGLSPLPVFHYGENYLWLKKYLKMGHKYLALGGLVGAKDPTVFLNCCFSEYICDESGMPKVKVHGFGVTSFDLMFRYPWYSVDSTSWVVTGRLGSIFIPQYKGGQFDYSKFPHKISVSSVSPNIKDAGQHISNLSTMERQIFMLYLSKMGYKLGKSTFKQEDQTYVLQDNEKWIGKKPTNKSEKRTVEVIVRKGICNTYQLRDELNIKYYLELEKHMPQYPWAFKNKLNQKTLF